MCLIGLESVDQALSSAEALALIVPGGEILTVMMRGDGSLEVHAPPPFLRVRDVGCTQILGAIDQGRFQQRGCR